MACNKLKLVSYGAVYDCIWEIRVVNQQNKWYESPYNEIITIMLKAFLSHSADCKCSIHLK